MAYAPENTLASFNKAIELGVDAVEFDVQVCKSGELIVMHDDLVDRTTDGTGYVAELSLTELKKLDAGKGQKVLTAKEALDAIDRKTRVNIDLKGLGTAAPVMELIRDYVENRGWQLPDFIVSSFDHRQIKQLHDLEPQLFLGTTLIGVPMDLAAFGEQAGASFVMLHRETVAAPFVKDAKRRGLEVYVFTVDGEIQFAPLRGLGIDAVYSNAPDTVPRA